MTPDVNANRRDGLPNMYNIMHTNSIQLEGTDARSAAGSVIVP